MKKLITIALAGLICFWLTALPVSSDPGSDPNETVDTLLVPPPQVSSLGLSDSTDTIIDPDFPWDNPDR